MKSFICYFGENPELRTLIRHYDYIDLKKDPDYVFLPGNRYLVFEKEAYDVIVRHQRIHLGPRSEGFYELTKCPYLLLRNGVIFKFKYLKFEYRTEWLNKQQYDQLLPNLENIRSKLKDAELATGISKKSNKPYYRLKFRTVADFDQEILRFLSEESFIKSTPQVKSWKLIQTELDVINSFNYFTNQDVGMRFGLDYETSGFPFDDPKFFHMGVGIADQNGICAFYNMELMQRSGNEKLYSLFLKYYKKFLDKHHEECYTYNAGFELRATYLLFKKMYRFNDSGTLNKLDGAVERYYSLKYTAMKFLGVASWDDDFDYLTNQLFSLMYGTYEKKVLVNGPSTLETFESDSRWVEIKRKFPEYEQDFKELFKLYWGYNFRCIPAEILGKYCCMDSYFTVLLRFESDNLGYKDLAWKAFDANMRLGAHLEMNGAYIDEDLRKEMANLGHFVNAYGSLNIAKLYVKMELEELGEISEETIPEVTNILKKGWNPFEGKSLIRNLFNRNYEFGIDVSLSYEILGIELTDNLIQLLKQYTPEITDRTFRLRNIFKALEEFLKNRWNYKLENGVHKFLIDGIQYQLNKSLSSIIYYYKLKNQYNLIKFYLNQLNLDKIDTEILGIEGDKISIREVEVFACSVFNYNSPFEYIKFECRFIDRNWDKFMNLYNTPQIIYDSLISGVDVPPDSKMIKEFYESGSEIICLKKDVNDFIENNYDLIFKESKEKPNILLDILLASIEKYRATGKYITFLGDLQIHKRKFIHSKFDFDLKTLVNLLIRISISCALGGGLYWLSSYMILTILQRGGFSDYEDKLHEISKLTPEWNIEEISIRGIQKFCFCHRLCRKYNKLTSTYIEGMLIEGARKCQVYDENGVSISRYGEGEAWKVFPKYMVCCKKSKRWASNFHTIPSRSEVKRIVTTPPGYLLSYFDISGMEVRSMAYLANDEFLLNCYDKGIDPYIELGKMIWPDKDSTFWYANRPDLKGNLLGSLYGMGSETMGARTDKSPEEAQELLDKMFTNMKGAKKFIEEYGEYPHKNGGRIKTILGDKLEVTDEPTDRWSRLGCNLVIQGGSAVVMAYGFENIIQDSYDHPEGPIIRPMNVVHDSSQNYFQSKYIFDIHEHYHQRLTEFLWEKVKIKYEFDTLVGVNYFDMAEVKVLTKNSIQLKGSYTALTKLCHKLKVDDVYFIIESIKSKKNEVELLNEGIISTDFKPESDPSIIFNFYKNYYSPTYNLDKSSYRMIISR